jgi:hypothetical protein
MPNQTRTLRLYFHQNADACKENVMMFFLKKKRHIWRAKYLVIGMHINLIKQVRTSYYKTRERERGTGRDL